MADSSLLDALVERYGERAVLTVRPYIADSGGETLRWVLQVDGNDVTDADIAVREDARRPGVMVMLLVGRGDEVELDR